MTLIEHRANFYLAATGIIAARSACTKFDLFARRGEKYAVEDERATTSAKIAFASKRPWTDCAVALMPRILENARLYWQSLIRPNFKFYTVRDTTSFVDENNRNIKVTTSMQNADFSSRLVFGSMVYFSFMESLRVTRY